MRAVDLVQLKVWSDRLCRLEVTDPRLVVSALGVGVSPSAYIGGVGRMDPPPLGTTRCELGVVEGRFRSLTFTFREPMIDRGTIEDALGPGLLLRRVRSVRGHQVAYRVVDPNAPYSCDVVASFAEPPRAESLVTGIMLRRHRGVRRAA